MASRGEDDQNRNRDGRKRNQKALGGITMTREITTLFLGAVLFGGKLELSLAQAISPPDDSRHQVEQISRETKMQQRQEVELSD